MPFTKGHKLSGMKGKHHSEETKRKIRESNLGLKRLPETRKRISEAVKKNPTRYWLGKHRLDTAGEKQWNWKGGITLLNLKIRQCLEYRTWRSDIFSRDDFTCVLCDKRGGELNVDHFPKLFSEIVKNNNVKSLDEALKCTELWDLNNGRTLCVPCHRKTFVFASNRHTKKI